MRTSVIKTAVLGLTVASTSLFAEATYSPHKYQQNDWFAEFGGNTAMYVNPAGISETDQLEFSAAFFSSISGEASQEYVSLTFPMDYKHTLGFSFFENGASIDGGKSYGEYAFMLGYAYRLMHCIALGLDVSVLYINQFDEVTQVTLGADVGLSWNPLNSSKFGTSWWVSPSRTSPSRVSAWKKMAALSLRVSSAVTATMHTTFLLT